jgi:phenylpropionate dioxygenase-like ring-hydroxylating dioxygenase large terminal subunit
VRCFANACRHRGAPVVKGDGGTARLLVCQFHSWSYALDGSLARVPDERDFVGLCREDKALVPIRCEQWGGWWFVHLERDAVTAEPLLEFLAPLPALLRDVAASPVRVIDVKSTDLACNWKIVAEAFCEVYHAKTIHPTTVAPALDVAGTVISLFDHGHQNMISPVRLGERGDRREELDRLAVLPAMLQDATQPAFGIFPNVVSPIDSHGYPFLVFVPTAIDRTRLDVIWFAPDWGSGELPSAEAWERRLSRFDRVMDEDYENLAPIQRSVETAAHGGQVLNYQERRIWHVHAWIDKTIGPHLIDESLRVPDLLADWVEEPLLERAE